MKLTSYLCAVNLVILGICGGIYAFSGFDLLRFITFGSDTAYRIFLANCFVSAFFTIYSMIAFKPFKGLK